MNLTWVFFLYFLPLKTKPKIDILRSEEKNKFSKDESKEKMDGIYKPHEL